MARIYVYPRFSTLGAFGFRTGGPGLGNLFFPYARALVLAKERGWTLINPSWATVKLGPILRRERDARWYLKLFEPRGISGPRKTALLLTRPKFEETALAHAAPKPGSVVLTSGMEGFYEPFVKEREYVAAELRNMVMPEDRARIDAFGPIAIGVHIRLGDFKPRAALPIGWYVETVQKIRAAAGREVPVAIASDGTDEELAEILRLPGVRRLNSSAVVDLFTLSTAKVIVASNSTFSAWAAFIGGAPIIWAKRNPEFEVLFADDTPNEVVPSGAELPPALADRLRRMFA